MTMPISPVVARQLSLASMVVLVAMIFIGGEQPGAGALFAPPWDKVVHVLVYGSIAVLAGLAFPRLSRVGVLLVVAAIGGCDELHQAFLPGREAGLPDLLADIIGAVAFLPILILLRRNIYATYSYISGR
jgi:VanZ family protein